MPFFLNSYDIFKYTNTKEFSIANPGFNQKFSLNINLLLDLIEDNDYYNKLVLSLKNDNSNYIEFFSDDSNQFLLRLPKVIIIQGIFNLINSGILVINNSIKNRLINLNKLISINNYSYKEKNHIFNADLKEYNIPVSYYFDFLFLPDEKLEDFFKYKNMKMNIKKRYFIYGLITYLKEKEILHKYLFPPSVLTRIKKIIDMEYFDYESVNTYLETIDYNSNTNINSQLLKELTLDIDKYDNFLEFLMYVYIHMCKIFTYDASFYANNQRGEIALKHSDINNLVKISKENNKIVCYEFTSIFAFILKKYHINYQIHQVNNKYGKCHNYLSFRYHKYIIKVDAVLSIMESDLTGVKINLDIDGFSCLNKNKQTQIRFLEHLKNVYVKEKELVKFTDDLLTNLRIIRDKIKEYKLEIMDAISYIFSKKQYLLKSSDDKIIVIKKKDNDDYKPIMLFAIRDNFGNYNYIIYDYPTFYKMTREEIINNFSDNTYGYLKKYNIPGIVKEF